jgi:Predicted membrane-associated Zn-dependent proteases 1
MAITSILAFIVMLVVLVFVHELGHFIVALRMGIKVEEFGIGFPPRAATLFEHKGVKYTLNWLPLGGFVRFGGEGDTVYGVGSLAEAPPWRKIPVMLAGPLMNLFLAMAIFAVIFRVSGYPVELDTYSINAVFAGSPAAEAGFQADDILLSLNGEAIAKDGDVSRIASSNKGVTIPAVVERNGVQETLMVTPGPWTDKDGNTYESGLGIAYAPTIGYTPVNTFEAIGKGISYSLSALSKMIEDISALIGGLFTGNKEVEGGLAGPIGIARVTDEVIDRGGMPAFWRLAALLSINLFLINLLPIPALDGSHILFSLIEWVRGGKKVPPEKEALVHAIGFIALMTLMLVVSISDIMQAIRGESILGS